MEANHQDILVLLRSLLEETSSDQSHHAENNQIYLCCAKEETPNSSEQPLIQILESITQDMKRFAQTNLKQVEIHAGFGKFRNQLTSLRDSLPGVVSGY